VAFAVAGHRHRVDREHRIARGEQRAHPRTAVSLDPNDHLIGREHPGLDVHGLVVEMLGNQLMKPGHSDYALRQPGPNQPLPGGVKDLHIVVVLGPVITHEQRHHCLPRS
jgi:hypothetical protein